MLSLRQRVQFALLSHLIAKRGDQVGDFLILGKALSQIRQYQIAFFVSARGKQFASFSYMLLAALTNLDFTCGFEQPGNFGFPREFVLQARQQGYALVAAPSSQQSSGFSQTLKSALIRFILMNFV